MYQIDMLLQTCILLLICSLSSRYGMCFTTYSSQQQRRQQQQQQPHIQSQYVTRTTSSQTAVPIKDSVVSSLSSSTLLLFASKLESDVKSNNKLQGLKVAVIGGGPSGLLTAHKLLKAGATVAIYERRSRPSNDITKELRAYALGVGIRGRTAIQSVDDPLWQTIKQRGFSSERFILHIGPLSIRLRDENDSKMISTTDTGSDSMTNSVAALEPSLLLYQSDLCSALTDELYNRYQDSGRFRAYFDCAVSALNFQQKTIVTDQNSLGERFDLFVGCDGVNSIVRKKISNDWSDFQTSIEPLPGVFKVIQCPSMPPQLDPTAVQLVFPKAGSVTAFVEPLSDGRCCILFAGNNSTDILFGGSDGNKTAIQEALLSRYPKLTGLDTQSAAAQLMAQGVPTQASRVTCNIYHYGSAAVLTGDAAHATGGVSGQGVNSALQDASVLVDTLVDNYDTKNKENSIRTSLLEYSLKAVPEGKALYDLSFGPKPSTSIGKIRFGIKSARDILFKGKFGIGELPLQTMLTLSLKSFARIRRERDTYYEIPFPSDDEWKLSLTKLDAKVKTLVT